MPWINHPATQDGPVSLWRWIKYQIGVWMWDTGTRLTHTALHPDDDDDLPF